MTNQQRQELEALRERMGMRKVGTVEHAESWMEQRRRQARIGRGVCPTCGAKRCAH
jgi:hypothetical protein